jgi:hypothetical protein
VQLPAWFLGSKAAEWFSVVEFRPVLACYVPNNYLQQDYTVQEYTAAMERLAEAAAARCGGAAPQVGAGTQPQDVGDLLLVLQSGIRYVAAPLSQLVRGMARGDEGWQVAPHSASLAMERRYEAPPWELCINLMACGKRGAASERDVALKPLKVNGHLLCC